MARLVGPSLARRAATSGVLHRSLHQDPLRVVSAKGNYLHLNNGQKVFDASGGAAVACLGHGDERVEKAVLAQMQKVSYCHSVFYGTEAAERLADTLIESTNGAMARVFVVSSGSESIEAALKFARQYHLEKQPAEPQRTQFIARQQSYHGTTLGALAVGGHVARRAAFEPILSQNSSHVSPCYRYRGMKGDGETYESYVGRLEAELDAEFQRVGADRVAAFLAEPVVGAALGSVPAVPGYFKAMKRVCDKYGALLIMDEIMSGCGRSAPEPSEKYPSPIHAWQDPSIDIVPDVQVMGKGLGGGYMPVAAMLLNHRVVDALQKGTGAFKHGQTYQGHPVACAAALEVQRIIRDDNLMANARKQGALLGKLLQEKVAGHWAVGDVRGMGLFWGVEFVRDKKTKEPFELSDAVASGIWELALQEPFSISLYPGNGTADGTRGDHIQIAPSYKVTEEEIRYIVDTTAAVIEEFFKKFTR
ncbi:pyridoxal phosphate-dependent transferase [Neohortaea acidophila]|uniref:Pyridoxal phosphate-dependent transferase n=1 Tax=Neohortaea acidophila TaxID=245834 RepID=A0A6A6PZQ8_9PEZI|nr:pyridoxal phosphate-dependent transferase [Neohortaea acidophila]KAF2485630.1 pyridoxal phosphate-dependent transferase [Neohortaea acidophila]